MSKRLVVLDDQTTDGLRSLGSGNLSAGIRYAWEMIKAVLPANRRQK